MGASAGDLLTKDVVCNWLDHANVAYDVLLAPPFEPSLDWQQIDPQLYSHVIFVCGPFGNGPPITDFLPRFAHCRLVGLNLSMLEPLEKWNPFNVLLERDSSRIGRPDICFLSDLPGAPVAGLVLAHKQTEYGPRALHEKANTAIERLVASRDLAVVPIDTRLDENSTGLRSPAEVESLIARMDVILTTRLHGTVLALKNGVPVVAVDPIDGGAKVTRQAETINWPVVFGADTLSDHALQQGLEYCLTSEGREAARTCAAGARELLHGIREELLTGLHD